MNSPIALRPHLEPAVAQVNEMELRSPDAEASVLGSLMHNNRHFDHIADLAPQHFSEPLYQLMFAEMLELYQAGVRVDPVTVDSCMLGQIGLQEIGGINHLRKITAESSCDPFVRDHVRVIRRLAVRRELVEASQEIKRIAQEAQGKPEDLIGEAEGLLRNIGAASMTRSVSAPDAAGSMIDDLGRRGLACGFAAIEKFLGELMPGDMIVIGGRPGMGKSSLGQNIAYACAKRGKVAHIASLEMSAAQLMQRSLSRMTFHTDKPIPYQEFRRQSDILDKAYLRQLARGLPKSLVIDDLAGQSLAHLEAACRATKGKFKQIDLVVVDYLQLVNNPNKTNRSYEDITAVSQGLKRIAKRLECPVIALSQLNRAADSRNDKRPQLSDLRESGAIEQDADAVLFPFREAYYLDKEAPERREGESAADFNGRLLMHEKRVADAENTLELIVAKNRHGACGSEKMRCAVAFDVIEDWQ